jgi:hypothetical protein
VSKLWQPKLLLWPDVDGPLFTHLAGIPNASAWIYNALVRFANECQARPAEPGEPHAFRTVLRKEEDADLISFFQAPTEARRRHLIRSAAWFKWGQQTLAVMDAEALAQRVVRLIGEQGVLVEAPPAEASEEDKEIILDIVGGWVT